MILAIDIALLVMLAVVGIAVIRMRNLFAVVMLFGIYSFLMAGIFVLLDAVDVAFTEAAVGAGISTVLMLGALALTKSREKIPVTTPLLPLVVVLVTGGLLIYGTSDLPDLGVPNVVTAVLASYRGYDTLGETTVIFTAGLCVLLLLSGRRRREDKDEGGPS
jgi:multicomponent Na+:H+ antiporter subunit B